MATRAAGITKKPEIVKAAFASVSASDVIRAPVALKQVPLDLAPLLAPFKRRGRLSLRIERMPQQARLSHGQNNGDGSWSLAADDLEGLTYLIPETFKQPHNLSLRVMATEGGEVSTLKVIDVPVSPDAPTPAPEQPEPAAMDWGDLASLRRLQDELAQTQALLAARTGELAQSNKDAEAARNELRKFEAELAAAHVGSKAELSARAAATTAQEIEQARIAWQAEAGAHAAKLQTEAERHLAEERERWQRESQGALAKVEAHWKADGATRLAAAETQQREHSAHLLAKAKTQREAAEAALTDMRKRVEAASGASDMELKHLRKELMTAQTALTTRESELAKQRTDNEQARQRWQKELENSLADLRTSWTADEAVRLNAGEARWRAKSDAALAQAAARSEAAEAALAAAHARADASSGESGAELTRLRKELAKAQIALAGREKDLAIRDGELAAQRVETERARAGKQQDSEIALVNARAAWKTEEAARLAAAEAKWRQQSAAVLAEATERREEAERELAQARDGQENDTSLADARKAWKADEAARIAAAETKWRQQSAAALADATERYEAAERALAAARNDAARPQDDAYVNRLRGELTALQGVLVAREAELAHARAEQSRPQNWPQVAAQPNGAWVEGGPEEQSVRRANLKLIRDVIVVVSLVMSLILFWPRMVSFMPGSWRQSMANLLPGSVPVTDTSVPAVAPPAPAAIAKQETAIVAKSVNVRAAPSTSAAVVAKLPHDAEVAVFERQGKWTSVGTTAQDGKPAQQQGWVFSSYLKVTGDPSAPAPMTSAPAASATTVPSHAAATPAASARAAAPPATSAPAAVAEAPAVEAPAPAETDANTPH